MFHWGLHPWAIYALVGLSLAFLPLIRACRSPSDRFYPVGERCWGWAGHLIDLLAVLATIFGLATLPGTRCATGCRRLEFSLRHS
ncbi:MAG: BCCT family transporter [Candidatus Competibacteraceae bacterium]